MGSLRLPDSGRVYVDTQILIYSVETIPKYWPHLQPLWGAARAGTIRLISSELTLLETLVGPLRAGDSTLASAYEEVFRSPELEAIPISQPILREAARLRATIPSLRTPDALHAATAMLSGIVLFVTNDMAFRKVARLPLAILDDVLVS